MKFKLEVMLLNNCIYLSRLQNFLIYYSIACSNFMWTDIKYLSTIVMPYWARNVPNKLLWHLFLLLYNNKIIIKLTYDYKHLLYQILAFYYLAVKKRSWSKVCDEKSTPRRCQFSRTLKILWLYVFGKTFTGWEIHFWAARIIKNDEKRLKGISTK